MNKQLRLAGFIFVLSLVLGFGYWQQQGQTAGRMRAQVTRWFGRTTREALPAKAASLPRPTLAQVANGPACGNYANRTIANGLGSDFVRGVYAVGNTIYAATGTGIGTDGGLSISTDGGVSFTNRTTANGLGDNLVTGVQAEGNAIYAATIGGVSISTDGGVSFTNRTTAHGLGSNAVYGVYAVGSTVYAATDGGLSISTNGGASFANRTTANGLFYPIVLSVYAAGSTVYAATTNGTDGALAISTDGGMSFSLKLAINSKFVNGVYAVGSTVYAATDGGLSISTNGGSSFTNRTTANGLGSNRVNGVYALGSTVYAATVTEGGVETGGLAISTDGGASFINQTPNFNGLGSLQVYSVYATTTSVYAGTAGGLSLCPSFSSAPVITPLVSYIRQQGSPAIDSFGPFAAVRDNETPAGNLVVTATTVPAGITVSSITNNAGLISAAFAADCTAALGNQIVVFTVTDGNGETGTCNVEVNVIANDAPTLSYGNIVVNSGGAITNSPATATDNGSITGYAVQSQGTYTGAITVNAAGVVSISGAAPLGNHTITIRGTDNCGVNTTASFTLSVLAPGVSVNGNNQPIANGDTTPSVTDGTDFGSAAASTSAVAHYFTITNTSAIAVNLTGNPRVALSGPNAADFSIALQPASPVAATNGVTTFLVNFAPTATGTRTATVSIANDVPSINPYTFTIQGAGTPPPVNGSACGNYSNRTSANGLGSNSVNGVFAVGSTIYVAAGNGTTGGLSISTDGGASFTNRTTANGLGDNRVLGVYAAGNSVYAATFGGVSISTDGGASFTNRTAANGLGSDAVLGVYAAGNTVYAATTFGLSISTDGGAGFTNRTTFDGGLGANRVTGVYAVGSTIYAATTPGLGTTGGLSISTNGGASFTFRTTGNGLGSNSVNGVYAAGNTVYAATDGGLSISTNGGSSFTNRTITNGLGNNLVRGVYAAGSTVYAATDGGLSISTDGGASFTNYTTANGLGNNTARGVHASGASVYAATDGGLSLCRACPAITINPSNPTLPNGRAGTPYSQTFTQTGGAGAATFSVSSGALPAGLNLNSGSGLLGGAPIVSGTFNFTIRATDVNNCFGEQAYTLFINPPCITITVNPATLVNGFQGTAYSQTLTATGGGSPYTFALTTGSLPNGLTLASGGALTGTPTTSGNFSFTVTATDNTGCTGTRSHTVIISGDGLVFYPLPRPVRILDTRANAGNCDSIGTPITGGSSLTTLARITCEGITIPPTARAIVGNLTVINRASQIGFLTIYPDGQPLPLAANMVYEPEGILSNSFTVGLSSDGKFNVFGEKTIDAIVDISGYYAPPGVGGLYYHSLSKPVRLLDTRPNSGNCDSVGTPIAGSTGLTTLARVSCEGVTIPSAAQAIVGNATVINGSGQTGFLTIYPNGVQVPLAGNMVYFPGQILSNAFTVSLSANGEFNIFGERTIDMVIDVAGYYSSEATDANGPGLLLTPLERPLRILDTRPSQGNCDAVSTPITGGTSIAGPGRLTCEAITIPATAQTVLGNVTVINQTAQAGFLTLYPDGVSQPVVGNMVYFPGQILSNAFVVGLNSETGQFRIFAERTLDSIVDVSGFFAP